MSNDIAIRVQGLGKMFRIGVKPAGYKTFRDTVTGLFKRTDGARKSKSEPFWALKDVSFEIKRGEVVGIIGRNGAGKSTLLKILSRITEPTEGFAEIHGRVGSLLEVGTGFHPELTGRENVFLNGAILGMRRVEIEAKFDEIVAFAEVEKFIDTPVKHYSSGMYLRLAFSVAAHLEPEILIVDEVLSVGDASFQSKCLARVRDIGNLGRTVVLVSHDMTAVSHLASKVILLEVGRVSRYGEPQDVISYYLASAKGLESNIETRTDRQGDGLLKITKIEFADCAGDKINVFESGQTVQIAIHYSHALPALTPSDIALDIRFVDAMGHPITTVSTRFIPTDSRSKLEATGVLVCYIPELLLAEEHYWLDLWLAYRGAMSDYITRACEINVIGRDVFGCGQAPVKRKHGAQIMQQRWSSQVLRDHNGITQIQSPKALC
jgi:lipopolysaccharide transport system ATP-binding protein